MLTFTVKSKGQLVTFTSRHDNLNAMFELKKLTGGPLAHNTFAKDLVANSHRLTQNQWPWVHKFVFDHENRQVAAAQPAQTGLQSIVDHLKKAKEHLQYPTITLESNGVKAVLKLCGARSKHSGKVSVAESHKFGVGRFFGYIDVDGSHRIQDAGVVALLTRVAVDPARVISEIGKESGHCCYCHAELTTVQSKIAGCGDTCGQNYNMWYPNAAEARKYLQDHPEILVGASDAHKWQGQAVQAGG